MGYALNAITSVSGFAPAVRAEPSAAVGSMEAFVADKRRLRASWGAIAAMIGVSEHVLRRSFDRTYQPPPGLDRPKSSGQAERAMRRAAPAANTGTVTTGDVVRLLAQGPASHDEICAATGGDARTVSDILANGRRRGLFSAARVHGQAGGDWSLTATGRLHRAAPGGAWGAARARVSKLDLLTALLKGPMTVAEATQATNGMGGTVATYMATLRAQGLATASPDGANGRLRYGITQAGRDHLAEARTDA
jgi:hypothetical protein